MTGRESPRTVEEGRERAENSLQGPEGAQAATSRSLWGSWG